MTNKKIKLNIIGNIFGQSGYDIHTRSLANAMNKLDDIDVCLTCQLSPDWLRHVTDDELAMIKRSKEDADVNLLIGLPPSWEYYLCEDKDFIGFLVFEGDKIPKGWLNILNDKRVSQIWVPSMHTKEAIINTLYEKTDYQKNTTISFHPNVEEKIKIVPHGIDPEIFKPIELKEQDSTFKFMMNGGWPQSWNDRKGLSYGIKAFIEEFTNEENIEMIVKINSCYGIDLNKNIKELNVKNQNAPKINFVLNNLKQQQLNELYNKCDVFVTTSLAESFNLPPLESMACKKPVLATEYGGQSDFVSEENGWLLKKGEMEEVKWDISYENIKWKKPSIEEIRKRMRDIYNDWKNNNSKIIKEKGKKSVETSKKFTWENSAKIALKNLK